jgi:hypothetical protein
MNNERPSALLRLLPDGDDAAAQARVLDRLATRRRAVPWKAGVGLAAAVLLGVGVALNLPPSAVEMTLDGTDWQSVQVSDAVSMDVRGVGQVSGTVEDTLVTWAGGQLHVDIDPSAGVQFAVETPEATATALGTVFSVLRDDLGTRVEVGRGRVELACDGGATHVLGPRESAACFVERPGELLARARLESPSDALMTLDRAMQLEPGDALLGELRVLRIDTLLTLGRVDDARDEADTYLGTDGPREGHVLRGLAEAAYTRDGCDSADTLEALGEHARALHLVWFADCLVGEPDRARPALERALELSPEQAETIQARLDSL